MLKRLSLCLPLAAAFLPAQEVPGLMSAVTPQQRFNITHNSGLRTDGADQLRGGGPDYRVRFTRAGMRFEPALGVAVETTQHLQLQLHSVNRVGEPAIDMSHDASPQLQHLRASYQRASGVTERYDVRPEGVELSWQFDARPAGSGDLRVRYAIDTSLPSPIEVIGGGLQFTLPDIGGVSIGGVTGIDANGATVAGGMRLVDGMLELSLPQSFVDEAAYPIVLDPLVGSVFTVQSLANTDSDPDVAYDSTTSRYLVVWRRWFSASSAEPRGQLVTSGGTVVGSTLFFNANGECEAPRVANLPTRDRFGVTFVEQDGLGNAVRFVAVSAANGSFTHEAILASSTGVQLFLSADIGSDTSAPIGSNRGFVVVYEDNIQNAIRARRVYFNTSDSLVAPSAFSVFSNTGGIGASYTQPVISRASGSDSRLLIAVRRFSGLGPFVSINVAAIFSNSSAVIATTSLGGSQTASITAPDVDGFQGKWVVAWQQATGSLAPPSVVRRTVQINAAGNGFDLGPNQTIGGSSTQQASAPTVAYTPGRTWLGYRYFSGTIFALHSLRAAAIDSNSATWCSDVFSEPIASSSTDRRMAVGTMTSGGQTTGEGALAVFGEDGDIYGQRLLNYGSNGSTYANLGGGCGSGGSPSFSHLPGIGSSGLIATASGLPNSALAAIFNLSSPTATLACGACEWTPFQSTLSPPIVNNSASVEFPIPCLPSLVGAQFDTQWTTIDFTQAPCSLFPGLVLSDRVRMTLGN